MKPFTPYHRQAMSEEQLSALFAKLKNDEGFLEKLKSAADLDAAVALANEAGFDVSKADWLKYQAKQTLELSDEQLEGVAGGAVSAILAPISIPTIGFDSISRDYSLAPIYIPTIDQ